MFSYIESNGSDAKNLAAAKDIANQVLAGSNVSHGATDNSSQGLAEREAASGKFKRVFKAHGESFFVPGWGEKNWERKYPGWLQGELQRGKMMRAANAAKSTMPNMGAALGGTATDDALHGDALRRHFGHRGQKHADLLGNARDAGLVGAPLQHKVTGSATLDVNFNGAPKGTTHRLKADGMFKEVKLNRGRAMPPANQEA